jgi:nucleoside-diphosphate-sugar epimerase
MHTLILGASGSTGQALIRYLGSASPTIDLTAVSRTATALPGVQRVLTGHYGDLFGSTEGRRQLAGIDAVVHLADGLSVLQKRAHAADSALADRLLASSRELALAVRDARVPLLLYVSSIKAIAGEEDARVLVEDCEPRATTPYGRCKRRLEEVMAQILAGSETRLVIVRNPVMYGDGGAGSLHRLLQIADTPLPLPLGGLDNKRSILAVRNFASALAAVVRAGPSCPSGVFHVHDGPALSTTSIVATLRAALGRPTRLFSVGLATTHAARRAPLLAPLARRLYGSLELSDAHFRRSFDWMPVVETTAALTDMVRNLAGRTGMP